MRTEESLSNMPKLDGDGESESGSVLTISGQESHALTTMQTTPIHLRTESLNDLVKIVDDLVSKYLEACAILTTVTTHLVKRGRFGSSDFTTDVIR